MLNKHCTNQHTQRSYTHTQTQWEQLLNIGNIVLPYQSSSHLFKAPHNNNQKKQHVLELLLQLSYQPRWMLWLATQHYLSKPLLNYFGLPAEKTLQLQEKNMITTLSNMEKSMQTGCYSAVIAIIPPINFIEQERLKNAAHKGNTYGFIVNPPNIATPKNTLIQCLRYH